MRFMSFAAAAALFSLSRASESMRPDAPEAAFLQASHSPKGHSWAGRRRKLKARNRDHQARR